MALGNIYILNMKYIIYAISFWHLLGNYYWYMNVFWPNYHILCSPAFTYCGY
jgi:hypothetical protein